MIVAGSAVASTLTVRACGPWGSRAAASRAASTSSTVGRNGSTVCAMSEVPLSPWSTRPRTSTTSSTPSAPSYSASALPKIEHLDRALEVVEGGEHHRVALLGADLLGLGDDAPGRDPVAVLAVGQRGQRRVDGGAQRLAHLLERVRGDEEPDGLLLDGQQLGLLELLGRDRRVLRRHEGRGGARVAARRGRRGRRSSPGRSGRRAGPAGPAACACSSTPSMPLRVAPVEPKAPHLMSASIARLLTARGSTRVQKSQIDPNSPPSSRAALIASTAAKPDALDRVEPEADVAVDDDELVVGEVDVGRQDVDPHALGLGGEERDLVLRVHDRGDQRGHVLGGVVGLQPRRAVGDQRVARGVGLVERVVGRALVRRPQPVDDALRARRWRGSPRRTRA